MKRYNTLILGATTLACPLAAGLSGKTLVVGGGSSVGAEFSEAMNASPVPVRERSGLTAEFCRELSEKGMLLPDGRIHILSVGGVLSRMYLDHGIHLRLGTAVLKTEKADGGFITELFCPETGSETVFPEKVIDTRVRRFMKYRKLFSVMLAGEPDIDAAALRGSDAFIRKGVFPDEYIFRLFVPREASVPECLERADGWLRANRPLLGKACAAGISLEFGCMFDKPELFTENGVVFAPSASYPDVVSAFEGGEAMCL